MILIILVGTYWIKGRLRAILTCIYGLQKYNKYIYYFGMGRRIMYTGACVEKNHVENGYLGGKFLRGTIFFNDMVFFSTQLSPFVPYSYSLL